MNFYKIIHFLGQEHTRNYRVLAHVVLAITNYCLYVGDTTDKIRQGR